MKTFKLENADGKTHGFEINNASIGRRGVVRVVEGIPGATVLKRPKRFSWLREAEFCQFELDTKLFVVEEPWSDNSCYLVSAVPPGWCPQIDVVEAAFGNA